MNHVIELLVATTFSLFLGLLGGEWASNKEAGGRDCLQVLGADQIPRYLESNKLIVGHISIESANYKVSIPESILSVLVEGIAVAFGKTD